MAFGFLCNVLENRFVVVGQVDWEVTESKMCGLYCALTTKLFIFSFMMSDSFLCKQTIGFQYLQMMLFTFLKH